MQLLLTGAVIKKMSIAGDRVDRHRLAERTGSIVGYRLPSQHQKNHQLEHLRQEAAPKGNNQQQSMPKCITKGRVANHLVAVT